MTKHVAAACAVLLAMSGCGRVTTTAHTDLSEREEIKVVATTGMVGDLAKHVGAGRVEVETLMGPGIDPHLYKASEGDIRRLEGADLILFNGLHLEAKLADVLERIGSQRRTQAVTDLVPRSGLLRPAQFAGSYDPHVWFDVRIWMDAVRQVRETLSAADRAHAPLYRRNAERYLAELERLDAYVRAQAGRVPTERRVLITAHDAFNYFGRAYGFEVRGLQGISTATEAGASDVSHLAEFIAERRIPAIFVETSVSPRTIEAVRAAVRSRGYDVQIGGRLFSDAMGDPGTFEGTYVGMVRHNVDAIVAGLLGEDL